jgi:hypothetical protein
MLLLFLLQQLQNACSDLDLAEKVILPDAIFAIFSLIPGRE